MNLHEIEDELDRREPQPELNPGMVLCWCVAGMVCIVAWCGAMHALGVW